MATKEKLKSEIELLEKNDKGSEQLGFTVNKKTFNIKNNKKELNNISRSCFLLLAPVLQNLLFLN